MSVGDKVTFPILLSSLPDLNFRALNALPIIGTIIDEPTGTTSTVSWPNGIVSTVPNSVLAKMYPLSAFNNALALSWGDDIGKYVQLTDWPIPGQRAAAAASGVPSPPKSPAASGILVMVYGSAIYQPEEDEPTFIIGWVAVQDGRKHIPIIGADSLPFSQPAFSKPYNIQPGRRAVGYGP
jgi:hypothetical protein